MGRYSQPCYSGREHKEALRAEVTEKKVEINSERLEEGDDASIRQSITDGLSESDPKKEVQLSKETKASKVRTWAQIRSSLGAIENIMSSRVKKRKNMKDEAIAMGENHLQLIEKTGSPKSFDDLEEKVFVNDVLDESVNASIAENSEKDGTSKSADTTEAEENLGIGVSRSASMHAAKEEFAVNDGVSYNVGDAKPEKHDSVDGFYCSESDVGAEKAVDEGFHVEPFFSWKEELECLVRGGVPKDLRGEVKLAVFSLWNPPSSFVCKTSAAFDPRYGKLL